MSFPALRLRPFIVGLGLASLTFGLTAWLPMSAQVAVHAVLLGAIGAIYVGFAIADGRRSMIALEVTGALAFLAFGVSGLTVGVEGLVLGYVLHGVWDVVHHRSKIPNRHAPWYIPLCAVYDVAVAAYLSRLLF